MPGKDFQAREAELDRQAAELVDYRRHAVAFAAGGAFVLAGAALTGVSRWLGAAGFIAAGAAWIYSGLVAWRTGTHMFGGFRTAGFGQFLVTRNARGGARVAAVVLIALGALAAGAAVGALS